MNRAVGWLALMTSSVADAFAALLAANSAAPVAWTARGVVTRSDLDAAAKTIQAELREIPHGGRIGISVRDGVTFLATFLAICRRGDTALLLDAADPRAPRLDLAMRWLATAVVCDATELRVHRCLEAVTPAPFRAIKLTSGSTGEPTPIGVRETELLADAEHLERTMGIGDQDRVFAAVPMSFSYGVGNLLMPALTKGRCLVLPANGPLGILQALRNGEPTVLPAVPALLRALLRGSLQLPASMRLVISAGAVLQPEVARQFRERFALPVHVFYGSTESGGVTFDRTGSAAERGLVGTPVHGVDVQIGAHGRVVVRSPAVGTALQGRHNPDAGVFVAPDHGEWCGEELRLLGRVGAVFDVGGHKVDPSEVQRLIEQLPEVVEAAVLSLCDEDGRAICGAVVAGSGIAVAEVRRHCARVLPLAKVPRRLAVVEQLPRTSRGKLAHDALRDLLLGANARSAE